MRTSTLQILMPSLATRVVRAWVQAVTGNGGIVSPTRQKLVRDLYVAPFIACGAWALLDDAALLVAENATQALTTLKRRQLMAPVNAPTFTADAGYTFDGLTNYLDTGFVPTAHAAAMSPGNLRLSVYERLNVQATASAIGAQSSSPTSTLYLRPRSASTTMLGQICSSAATLTISADSRGLSAMSRASGTSIVNGYKNGAALTPATGVSGQSFIPAAVLYIGARNNSGIPDQLRASTLGYADWGASISAAQESAVYAAVLAFMTAVGANV